MNNSSIDKFGNQSTRSDVSTTLTAVIFLVSIAAFVGNFLVTVIFLMNTTLRRSTNYFIVNMAVSDLLSTLTNWPLYATDRMLSRKQVIADSMATLVCKLGVYSRAVSQGVSILSLLLIVVDRFIAIVPPFQARGVTRRLRTVSLLFSWALPPLSLFPHVWLSEIVQEGRQTVCKFSSSWSKIEIYIFYTIGRLVFDCVPLILIIILYSRIMKCLKRIRPVGEIRQSNRIRNRQQNRILMKAFIFIVIVFFLCWTPLCVYIMLKMFFPFLFMPFMIFLGLSY